MTVVDPVTKKGMIESVKERSSYLFRPPIANVGGTPIPLAQYLSTMDWRAVVFGFVILGLAVCMYYPFFKMYEKQLLEQEAAAKSTEEA